MDSFYEDILNEWSIDGSKYGQTKRIELAIQCTMLHFLQKIEGKLESIERIMQEDRKAKKNEN